MKIFNSRPRPDGKVRLFVELDADEHLRSYRDGQALVLIDPDAHYKLGEPMHEDVIAGHILADATRVHWCSIEQKWRD